MCTAMRPRSIPVSVEDKLAPYIHSGDDSVTLDYAVLLDSCGLSPAEIRVETYAYQDTKTYTDIDIAMFEACLIEHYWKQALKAPPRHPRDNDHVVVNYNHNIDNNTNTARHTDDGVMWYSYPHISPEEMRCESYLQATRAPSSA